MCSPPGYDNLRSTFILAHELGHAGHGMLSSRNQVISNTRTALFFVEAPSTANEMILSRHVLARTTDARLRRWLILQSLGTFTHNMVTHLLEAHFEQRLYDLAKAGQPLTLSTIMQVQSEVFERFYNGSVVVRRCGAPLLGAAATLLYRPLPLHLRRRPLLFPQHRRGDPPGGPTGRGALAAQPSKPAAPCRRSS